MARLLEYFAPVFSLGLAIDGQVAADVLHGHADDQARRLIEQARGEARAAGKAPPAVESAAFAVVAWFDEVIARNSSWRGADSPLQTLLFSTHSAGDEFFEHLANLKGADGEVREVYYHALLLGFVGPYYFEAGDHGELSKIKELVSLQLPVAPLSVSALRKERFTPQPYLIDDPPGPRFPGWRDVWRMKIRALVKRIATHSARARDKGALRQGRHDDEPETQTQMSAAIHEARHTISHAPELAGRQALYRVPWMLFLGDAEANVAGLMEAASIGSPFPAPAEDSESMWRWWLSPSMVAIETRPSIVCDTSAYAERGLWYRALTLLASERSRLPLNGIVVCIGARSLLNGTAELKETSLRLRRLVDESMQRLQLQLPLYVLVTGLELLPGYATFRAAIPPEIFAQALGWRLPERSTAGTSATFDSYFSSMMERLHTVRLSLLAAEHRLANRRGLFEFVQSIAAMQSHLRQLVELLQENNASQRTALWRGLYFVGAGDSAAPGGSFIADLFARFLPADQPLATLGTKTALAIRH